MLVPWLLLAAPVLAAALLWGSWALAGLAVLIAVAEYLALRRTEGFSDRVWRTIGVGRRSRHARAADALYLVMVVAGLAMLLVALVVRVR